MPPKNHVIAAILEASIQTAQARGASKETIALGLVAALSRLHAVVKEASEPMALRVRTTIRDIIIAHNLARLRECKTRPEAGRLPQPGSDTDRVAIAILEDAANSFLTLNGFTPDNDCIDAAVWFLTERLIAVLGAPPDYAGLADSITGTAGEGPSAFAIHRRTSLVLN